MTRRVYISSFKMASNLPGGVHKFSAAVYQPSWCEYPKAEWCDIRDARGWIRPNRFLDETNPLEAYRKALLNHYDQRTPEAMAWLNEQRGSVALLCWCPYERAAQRQLQQFGSFVCHTAVLAEFLSVTFQLPVFLDADRLRMAVLTQRPVP